MIVEAQALFLNAESRSFTDDKGRKVDFYRLKALDADYDPIELPLSKDQYEAGLPFEKLENVVLHISITPARTGSPRVRVESVQAL